MADPNLLSGDDVPAYIPSAAGDSLTNWLALARMRSVAAGWSDPPPNLLQAPQVWGQDNPVGTSSLTPPHQLTMPSSDVSPVIGNLGGHPVTAAANANALRLVGAMSQFGPADVGAIRAYHGSPADFSAFDDRYIGSGEGNQAYGYGHYAAGSEGVARTYRDQLAQPGAPRLTAEDYGLPQDAVDSIVAANMRQVTNMRGDRDFLQTALDQLGQSNDPSSRIARDLYTNLLNQKPGHMYELNIDADPEHMLDWDKPLSEQSLHVQDAIQPHVAALKAQFVNDASKWGTPRSSDLASYQDQADAIVGRMTGESFVHQLTSPGGHGVSDPVAAAATLRAAGIPGIRYLDAGSRGAGQGTSNFVIFDPKNIEILRKYGIGGLIAGGGVAAATQDNQSP